MDKQDITVKDGDTITFADYADADQIHDYVFKGAHLGSYDGKKITSAKFEENGLLVKTWAVTYFNGEDEIEVDDADYLENETRDVYLVYAKTISASLSSKYKVTVEYGNGTIPEGTTVSLKGYSEDDPEYLEALEAVKKARSGSNGTIDDEERNSSGETHEKEGVGTEGTLIDIDLPDVEWDGSLSALDISLVNGNAEIEPKTGRSVNVILEAYDFSEDDNLSDLAIHHIVNGNAVDVANINDESVTVDGTKVIAEFMIESFSTFTVSWTSGFGWDSSTNNVTIHYGYMENDSFVDFEDSASTNVKVSESSSTYRYLIYDFDGYHYASTHLNSTTGTRITPMLYSYYGELCYVTYSSRNGLNYSNLDNNSDIYVIYERDEESTTGYVPSSSSDGGSGEDESSAPDLTKTVEANGDGTYKVTLSVEGQQTETTAITTASVIVVFDVSGSMRNSLNGNTTRLDAAKTAVNTLASTLLDIKDSTGNNLVQMALISFSTDAQTVLEYTSDYSNYSSAVNALSAAGATNWEAALRAADSMATSSTAPTYVIFVTDGNPSVRITRGDLTDSQLLYNWSGNYSDSWYWSTGYFGGGYDDNTTIVTRCYNAATDEARSIVNNHKGFYTIGITEGVTTLENLTAYAYNQSDAPEGHNFTATDTETLTKAFNSIASSIKNSLGYSNVEIKDGTTSLSSVSANVSGYPGSFTYKKDDEEWTNAPAATFSNNTVTWNLGNNVLENGITYSVSFDMWPSQAAYDLVADLNNEIKTESDLTDSEKSQIGYDEESKEYYLKTNTSLSVAGKYGETDVANNNVDYINGQMGLAKSTINALKVWDNALDDRSGSDKVTLTITKDGKEYKSVDVTGTEWTSSDIYISPGVIVIKDGTSYVLETGHDYTVTEEQNSDYYWELTADTYHPMVINGELTILKLVDSAPTDESTYYTIDKKTYIPVTDSGAATLTATNHRRSNLNLTKNVVDSDNNEVATDTTKFSFNVTITDANNKDVWFSIVDANGDTQMDNTLVSGSGVTAEINNDGNRTGYYSVSSGTAFTVQLQQSWNLRVTNLISGSTYSITESDLSNEYTLKSVTSTTTTQNITGQTITGKIDAPNNTYQVTYTNTVSTTDISLLKTANTKDGEKLGGAKFSLTKLQSDGTTYSEVSSDYTGFTFSAEGTILSHLTAGTYKLTEVSAPDGYIITETDTYFVISYDSESMASITFLNGSTHTQADITGTTLTIINTPGTILPNTGGSGTIPFTLSGLMLIALAALMYGFVLRRNNKGRRFVK